MDRIEATRNFMRAAETGSFTEVARERNTTQPTISKQIAALEDYLGVQLLVRTTRSLSLTEEGSRFYEAAKTAIEGFEAAEATARGAQSTQGLLRIGCPVSFGQVQLIPRLAGFLERYPALSVDFSMSDAFLDPVEQGVDVVIRVGEMTDSTLKARRIGLARRVTVASPLYLQRYPAPDRPQALTDHECVLYTRLAAGPQWSYRTAEGPVTVRVRGRVQADNSAAMLGAVIAGLGIGLLPLWLAGEAIKEGQLVRLLQDFGHESLPIHAVSPPRRFTPPKVAAFIDHFAAEFRKDPHVSLGEHHDLG